MSSTYENNSKLVTASEAPLSLGFPMESSCTPGVSAANRIPLTSACFSEIVTALHLEQSHRTSEPVLELANGTQKHTILSGFAHARPSEQEHSVLLRE